MAIKTFELKKGEEYIELKNLVKVMSYVNSGGEAKVIIQGGEVQVNGETELRRGKKLRKGDKIKIQDDQIEICEAD